MNATAHTPRLTLDGLLGQLHGVRQAGDYHTAKCPGHDDGKNSLQVSQKSDGKIGIHCHAGCDIGDVLAPLGWSAKDLYPPRQNGRTNGKTATRKIVEVYDFPDANGKVIMQEIRYSPKDFRMRRPAPGGGHLWSFRGGEYVRGSSGDWYIAKPNDKGPRRSFPALREEDKPLYNLPAVIENIRAGKVIFLVEGPKDANSVNALGLVATTNANGANKWNRHYTAALKDAKVAICQDQDESGRKKAAKLSRLLPNSRIIELPGLTGKQEDKDVTDWLNKGNDADGLKRLVATAFSKPRETPPDPATAIATDTATKPEKTSDPLTELANARRLREAHGDDLLHSSGFGWLVWDGKRWARSEKAARRMAQKTGDIVRRECVDAGISDEKMAEKYWRFAKRMESTSGITATLKECAVLLGVDADEIEFDAHPWLLNCLNGTVDLKTGERGLHERSDYLTKLCPTPYKPDATCELFDKSILEIFEGDAELVSYVQWYAGLSLTGDVSHDCFAILYGEGANGKSTLITVLKAVIGNDFAQELNPEELLAHRGDRHSTELAQLRGARFVSAVETNEGRRLNESLIKGLSGGDKIRARFMRRDSFEFQPELKLWLATNHRPEIRDTSDGMWRRVRLIPFLHKFEGSERVSDLDTRLIETEAEGILAWAVEGAKRAAQGEPDIPEKVRAAVAEYRAEEDLVAQFVGECCAESPDIRVGKTDLHKAFQAWNSAGVTPPLKTFNLRIRARGYGEKTVHGSRAAWVGIGLLPSEFSGQNGEDRQS